MLVDNQILVSWHVAHSGLVDMYAHFARLPASPSHSRLSQNGGTHLLDYTAQHSSRPQA